MSVKPIFITGANAKIKLNGMTVAFATDISYTVEVAHATPQLLGMYEAANVEPLSYRVSGTLTIIRYAKNMKNFLDPNTPKGVSDTGNGIGAYGPGGFNIKTVLGNDGKANQSLDPKEFDNAVKFDIEIYQKAVNNVKTNKKNVLTSMVSDFFTPGASSEMQAVARLRDCRLVRTDFTLSKRSPAIQKFAFKAIYLDEDSFRADASGIGQEFM
jgi:hypothetical protein